METTPLIDVEPIAKHLKLELEYVRRITELLDEGNTVPFITRFRKDHTGGLDEQQVRAIARELNRERLLAERKETVLKSIESRGQLTDDLAEQVRGARALRVLEDIYLPYKPKKQSLASLARSKGIEPLATEILNAAQSAESLPERANALVDPANELPTADAVLEGVQHLIAEHYCNHAELRSHLRRHLWRSGKLVSRKIDEQEHLAEGENETVAPVTDESDTAAKAAGEAVAAPGQPGDDRFKVEGATADLASADVATESEPVETEVVPATEAVAQTESQPESTVASDSAAAPDFPPSAEAASATKVATGAEAVTGAMAPVSPAADGASDLPDIPMAPDRVSSDVAPPSSDEAAPAESTAPVEALTVPSTLDVASKEAANSSKTSDDVPENASSSTAVVQSRRDAIKPWVEKKKKEAASRRDQRRETRRRRRERLVQSFKDYFDFSDPIGRVPHHRILAINRGERTKVLRVKVECTDWDQFEAEAESRFIPQDHPYHEFLKKCFHYALTRLLLPSIEREVRRELNDKAEEHAVSVFARNLRKLLLQPPLCQHRVVAIDPGFRSGCKLVALDAFGNILGHTFINLLGKEEQKQDGRSGLINFVREHKATAIAIGNGAACRETEALVADVLTNEFTDQEVGYLIVNEAGTSVYSTSDLGREELPNHDATVRSAVSIGRRALDPLSELVKIDPASIGVGLYQHDVKAKHLRESLDAVVESCVNYVGVDVNSASPALLRYVSGLNSLTARRIFEHRQKNGPFKNREQLKGVSGIGNSTYVQAAGFLKVVDGEHPLDETWIHPESYAIATKVLDAIGFDVGDLKTAIGPANTILATDESSTSSAVAVIGVPDVPAGEGTNESTDQSTAAQANIEVVEDRPAMVEPLALTTERTSTEAAPIACAAATPTTQVEATSDEAATKPAISSEESTAEVAATELATTAPVDDAATVVGQQAPLPVSTPKPMEADAAARPQSARVMQTRRTNARAQELADKLAHVDVDKLAPELGVGKLLLEDILIALARPGRDPREDLPPPVFRRGILKLEDLKPGMELSGTVLNVVDFGAFVDIGLVDSGLIHVSRLADRYISDPHDVVSVGDILGVWVVEVDQKRRRVSLTAIEPGTERRKPAREERKPREARGGGRPQTGRARANRPKKFSRGVDKKPKQYKPKAPPKPVVPITKEMEEGKEPMRTFGDLKQLFEKKKKGGSK